MYADFILHEDVAILTVYVNIFVRFQFYYNRIIMLA